jgi:hypothetical protein
MSKILECTPDVAERLRKRLIKRGLVVGMVKQGEKLSSWASKSHVILVIKNEEGNRQ